MGFYIFIIYLNTNLDFIVLYMQIFDFVFTSSENIFLFCATHKIWKMCYLTFPVQFELITSRINKMNEHVTESSTNYIAENLQSHKASKWKELMKQFNANIMNLTRLLINSYWWNRFWFKRDFKAIRWLFGVSYWCKNKIQSLLQKPIWMISIHLIFLKLMKLLQSFKALFTNIRKQFIWMGKLLSHIQHYNNSKCFFISSHREDLYIYIHIYIHV